MVTVSYGAIGPIPVTLIVETVPVSTVDCETVLSLPLMVILKLSSTTSTLRLPVVISMSVCSVSENQEYVTPPTAHRQSAMTTTDAITALYSVFILSSLRDRALSRHKHVYRMMPWSVWRGRNSPARSVPLPSPRLLHAYGVTALECQFFPRRGRPC